MKFITTKKLSDNSTMNSVLTWMLLLFIVAMILSLTAKQIAFGFTPDEWISTVMGNPDEFIDPILFSDLLLSIHTDLFGLIITYILATSLYVRTSYSTKLKISLFVLLLICLLVYPLGLLTASYFGNIAIITGLCSFVIFHIGIMAMSTNLLLLLLRKRI